MKLLTSPVVRNNFGCIRWGLLFCIQTCWEAKGVKLQIGKIHVFSARCIRGNDQSMPSLLVKAWLTGRTTVVRPAAPIQSQLIPGRISRRKSFTGTTTVVSASDWRCLWESFYPREWQSTCPVSSQWLSSQPKFIRLRTEHVETLQHKSVAMSTFNCLSTEAYLEAGPWQRVAVCAHLTFTGCFPTSSRSQRQKKFFVFFVSLSVCWELVRTFGSTPN